MNFVYQEEKQTCYKYAFHFCFDWCDTVTIGLCLKCAEMMTEVVIFICKKSIAQGIFVYFQPIKMKSRI